MRGPKKVRLWGKSAIKVAKHQNHLRFNLHSKNNKITPVSIKLQRTVLGTKPDNILKKTERLLLNIRISDMISRLESLRVTIDKARDSIS